MDFEAKWAVIEAYIDQEVADPDAVLVDNIREKVRFGEVPTVVGPGMGLPAIRDKKLIFSSALAAQKCLQLMEELADQTQLEPVGESPGDE